MSKSRQGESLIKQDIITYLNLLPTALAFYVYNGAIFDPKTRRYRKNNSKHRPKGIPDIIGSYRGVPLAIEVKKPGERLSVEQSLWIDTAKRKGWVAFRAESLQEVMDYLAQAFKSRS